MFPPPHISVLITNSIACLVLFLVAFFFNSLIISVFYDLGMKNLKKNTNKNKRMRLASGSDEEGNKQT